MMQMVFSDLLNIHGVMKVAVGSLNEVKVEAVRKSFKEFFPDIVVDAVSIEMPAQPIGFRETLRGAVKRGLEAMRKLDADLGVGVEAGLIEIPHTITGYVDQHVCAIIDREEKVTLGFSAAFEFPVEVVESILAGKAAEAEEVMDRISGMREIGRGIGAIGYLTRKRMNRIDLCIQAVASALIPRINPGLYPGEWPRVQEII